MRALGAGRRGRDRGSGNVLATRDRVLAGSRHLRAEHVNHADG